MSCIIQGAFARVEMPVLKGFGPSQRFIERTSRHGKIRRPERLERVNGIEPSSSAWKAVALPLSYTRGRQNRIANSSGNGQQR